MIKKITLGAAAALTAFTALPAAAEAQGYGYYNRGYQAQVYGDRYARNYGYDRSYDQRGYEDRRYDDRRYDDRRYDDRRYATRGYATRDYNERHYDGRRCSSGTTGTIIGGAIGALLGRQVDRRGSRLPGTIIGGAAGAVAGRAIDKGQCR